MNRFSSASLFIGHCFNSNGLQHTQNLWRKEKKSYLVRLLFTSIVSWNNWWANRFRLTINRFRTFLCFRFLGFHLKQIRSINMCENRKEEMKNNFFFGKEVNSSRHGIEISSTRYIIYYAFISRSHTNFHAQSSKTQELTSTPSKGRKGKFVFLFFFLLLLLLMCIEKIMLHKSLYHCKRYFVDLLKTASFVQQTGPYPVLLISVFRLLMLRI